MCLAIPTRIKSIQGALGEVEVGGVSRTVGLQLVPQAQAGDYVLIHTGYAIGVIDEEEAQESLRLLNQIARGGEE